ncbi:TFIID-18kDa-domain-containing protein [Cutaneotrichosporon oleaginosum]|uniref:TFIID-18kDa-domain-containing protein n=1 Tax=Cutaneotrichosporon oleaginosum TaxID=879819 RepID=A0A0J0XYV1_9TREE|nr:TFIID-18kDa-domain-containing protein [Cutaneotrichosporon oleaginosum]KLT46235.1 TFIID-18kDa-domain-containing protein [Cutaneotrichosporon oleaginosum]TXT10241.1 hypothetical protein COLE_04175 [Cutaneotrichosporon oleaginosum]
MSGLAIPNVKRPLAGLALPGAPPSASNSPAPPSGAVQLQPRPTPAAPAAAGGRVGESGRPSASPSPEPDEDGDADGDDDEDEGLGATKKSSKSAKKKKGAPAATAGLDTGGKQDYKYTNEISQMMFVFGEVQDPLPETVKLVEDIVRGQIIEIVTRARLLTHIRSSRFLSAEDLIFLIRDDRGKVNRLRTYLSWKDVRKKAKEEEDGDVDVDEADKAQKGRKPIVKLSWELLTPFSDFLRTLPTQQNRNEEEDEEDDDELQAHQDSMQRLRDADEITKKMTKDEYVHYSDCRQASFTYRKARRFRDFINFSAYLDVRPNDDIVDILGFLAFEMVRSLCVTALEVREQQEKRAQSASSGRPAPTSPLKRKLQSLEASPSKRARNDLSPSGEPDDSRRFGAGANPTPRSLFAPPPSARQPLLPTHVLEAFAQIQRKQTSTRVGGMRNWRGGMTRGRVALV